jgi:hypothetical protein
VKVQAPRFWILRKNELGAVFHGHWRHKSCIYNASMLSLRGHVGKHPRRHFEAPAIGFPSFNDSTASRESGAEQLATIKIRT